jgi:2-keto-3-deoxy-L-rhamnonate aldolase RhmA
MTSNETLKQRIRNGDEIVGLRVIISSSREAIECALAVKPYDYLYVDGQHTAFAEQQLADFCAMAEDVGIPVQFRILHTREAHLVGRYFDLGPSMIVVPEVVDEQTVDEVVTFAYYPPVGGRSWGGQSRYGLRSVAREYSRLEYATWWNQQAVVSIMIESVEAVINAQKLAKPGIDYIGFGPADLQFSIEQHPEFPLRTIEECISNVSQQLAGTDIALALNIPTNPAERDRYRDTGITMFGEGSAG